MSQDLQALRRLSKDDKQRFFFEHRNVVKEAFFPEDGQPLSDFTWRSRCDHYITWANWDDTCTWLKVDFLEGLPRLCCHRDSTPQEDELLKDALKILLHDQTTKIFKDLL